MKVLALIKSQIKRVNFKILFLFFVFFLIECKHHKSTSSNSEKTLSKSVKSDFAAKLGVKESDIINVSLYGFINEWYGVPYKYSGKDKAGIDCSGLVSTLYLKVYKKIISNNTKALLLEVKKIKESDLKEGDLVFFNTDGKGVSHVGVYLQNHKFVHASSKKGVMVSDMNEPFFKKTYLSSGRVK